MLTFLPFMGFLRALYLIPIFESAGVPRRHCEPPLWGPGTNPLEYFTGLVSKHAQEARL